MAYRLNDEPIDYQLTVHFCNLMDTYGKSYSCKVIKLMLMGLPVLITNSRDAQIVNRTRSMIDFYGKNIIKNFFRTIYGWDV